VYNPDILKLNRITAGIIVLTVLAVILFSPFYSAAEACHDCSGDDCPVCLCIRQCENTLHQIGNGKAALVSAVVPIIFLFVSACLFSSDFALDTLVIKKVRLNN